MNLNSIKLSQDLIEDLYGDSLKYGTVKVEKKPSDQTPKLPLEIPIVQDLKWKTLGNNLKNVLIVVKNPGFDFLPGPEREFLNSILKACKLNLDDVALLNIASHEQAGHKEIIDFFKSRIVLLFDIEPSVFGIPMNFPHYQIQPFASSSYLYAPSLKILEADRDEKTKLWTALKRLFNI